MNAHESLPICLQWPSLLPTVLPPQNTLVITHELCLRGVARSATGPTKARQCPALPGHTRWPNPPRLEVANVVTHPTLPGINRTPESARRPNSVVYYT